MRLTRGGFWEVMLLAIGSLPRTRLMMSFLFAEKSELLSRSILSGGVTAAVILFFSTSGWAEDGLQWLSSRDREQWLMAQAVETQTPPASVPPAGVEKTEKQPAKKEEGFTSPEGKSLQSPFEIIHERPEIKRPELRKGTFGESLLHLGVEEDFTLTERDLIGAQVKTFIPPTLTPAIGQHAFILPPGLFQASIDYGFTNLTGQGTPGSGDFFGNFGQGNFNGVRRQNAALTLAYGFDLNRKYLHSFTAVLTIPYVGVNARGFVEPQGPNGPKVNNGGSVGELGDVSLFLKKKLVDQANFPVGISVLGGVFFPTGSNEQKAGNNGVVSCSPQCPNGQQTFTFTRFSDDGRLPTFLQPGTGGAWSYVAGAQVSRQFLPGHLLPGFLSGTPFDRLAIHAGGFHRWNFESNGFDPGGQSLATLSVVAPIYKDYLALDVTNLWLVQQADSYRGTFNGQPRQSATKGSTGLLGPSLIFSPDPIMRFRVTSLFRVKNPELGPAPPFLVNFGLDIIF